MKFLLDNRYMPFWLHHLFLLVIIHFYLCWTEMMSLGKRDYTHTNPQKTKPKVKAKTTSNLQTFYVYSYTACLSELICT